MPGMLGAMLWRAVMAAFLCLALGAGSHAAEDGGWTGRLKGLGQETVQVWVTGSRFKLFTEWPGGRVASADGEIRADNTVRICGSYQRSQQSDNLCIDGRFDGNRFAGRWSVGAGEGGEILLTRSGGSTPPAPAAPAPPAAGTPAQAPPAPQAPSSVLRRAAVVAVGDFIMPDGRANESGRQQLLSHLSRAGGSQLAVVALRPETARADIIASARYLGGEATPSTDPGRAAARAFGYNVGSPDRLRVTARVQVDLTRVMDGLLLSEIAEAGDKIESGANAQSAGATFANKAIGDAVQRLMARLSSDRQDFLAAIPEPPPPAPAARNAPQPTAGERPVISVGDFVMSDGARNETGRQLLIAALNRSAGDMLQVSALAAPAGRQDFRVTGRNLGAEATVTGTRGGRGARVNTFKVAVQVQIEMLRVVDGQVLTEQVELTDTVTGDSQAVNQHGAALLRTGIERAVAQLSGKLTGERRDFLSVPRPQTVADTAAPAAPDSGPQYDRATRRTIQESLRTLGLYRGAVDGELGSGSRAAIQSFQRTLGAAPSGVLTNDQLAQLKQQASIKQAADPQTQPKEAAEPPRFASQQPEPQRPEPARAGPSPRPDELAWEAIRNSNNPKAFAAFAQSFPNSPFAAVAAALADSTTTPVTPAVRTDPLVQMRKEPRKALVIGNAAYKDAPLKNPVNDARAMTAMLRRLGFDVIARENVTRDQLGQAIVEFAGRLDSTSAGLLFYAGHGIQSRGRNYLIPVDAALNTESDLRYQAVDVTGLIEEFELAKTRVGFVILDACRNNPFERRMRGAAPVTGLAAIDAARGLMIAYATAPGSVAADGEGDNGTYTTALLKGARAARPQGRGSLQACAHRGRRHDRQQADAMGVLLPDRRLHLQSRCERRGGARELRAHEMPPFRFVRHLIHNNHRQPRMP